MGLNQNFEVNSVWDFVCEKPSYKRQKDFCAKFVLKLTEND